eukprot:1166096_1
MIWMILLSVSLSVINCADLFSFNREIHALSLLDAFHKTRSLSNANSETLDILLNKCINENQLDYVLPVAEFLINEIGVDPSAESSEIITRLYSSNYREKWMAQRFLNAITDSKMSKECLFDSVRTILKINESVPLTAQHFVYFIDVFQNNINYTFISELVRCCEQKAIVML